MKKLLFFLAALCSIQTVNAQDPGFRARLERETDALGNTSYAVYLKLSGTSPFTASKNRFIGTAQFPIAVGKTLATPDAISVTMDPTFLANMTQTTGGPADFEVVVNPVVATTATANAGEHYFSVNLAAGSTVVRNIISSGVEFKVFSATFTGGNVPNPDSVKLLNVSYRLAPPHAGANNQQCQIAIEDNWAMEYTDPFSTVESVFYDKAGTSTCGSAGTTCSMFWGWMPGDYNSFSRSMGTGLKQQPTGVASMAQEQSKVSLTSNPINADTKLRITTPADQHVDYTVVDASGKLVTNGSLEVHGGSGDYELANMNALPGGIYYLTAKGASISTSIKMTK